MIDTTFEMPNKEPTLLDMFAQCPAGLEKLLEKELAPIADVLHRTQGGVSISGDMGTLVKLNLYSALATRVLVRIATFRAHNLSQLYKKASSINWEPWIRAGTKVKIHATCSGSIIYHTKAAQQRVQQALANYTKAALCSKDRDPDLMIHVRIRKNTCTISLDSSGQPLWQRGQRREVSVAPMRPNLAAAALQLVGFGPEQTLLDPMCGSGTIVIEALRITNHQPPGIGRSFAFEKWPLFQPRILEQELRLVTKAPRADSISIFASDLSPGAVGMTRRNLKRIGMEDAVLLQRKDLANLIPPTPTGIWICNPPYGKRLSSKSKVRNLYRTIGRVYSENFRSWRLALLSPDPELVAATGLALKNIGPSMAHGGLRLRVYQTGPSHR